MDKTIVFLYAHIYGQLQQVLYVLLVLSKSIIVIISIMVTYHRCTSNHIMLTKGSYTIYNIQLMVNYHIGDKNSNLMLLLIKDRRLLRVSKIQSSTQLITCL